MEKLLVPRDQDDDVERAVAEVGMVALRDSEAEGERARVERRVGADVVRIAEDRDDGRDPAIALIGELFRIERAIKDRKPYERLAVRQRDSAPVCARFFAWCDAEATHALDDTPIAKGLGYARNQRKALERFLVDGRLPIHNNDSERALRREVVGRKNWLFCGNDDAAEVNASFVTLLASAQLHALEPSSYLRDLFCLLPSWPARRVLELAPVNWKQTLEKQDARQRLDANVFRRAILELDEHRANK